MSVVVPVQDMAFSFSRLYHENSHFDGSYVASVGPSAIPAKAGIQEHRGLWQLSRSKTMWIPACAGMTGTMVDSRLRGNDGNHVTQTGE